MQVHVNEVSMCSYMFTLMNLEGEKEGFVWCR